MQDSKLDALRRGAIVAVVTGLTALLAGGCDQDDEPDDGTKDESPAPSSAWLVGEQGEMFRLEDNGDIRTYPLESTADFTAITCKGEATAWVVGEQGTILRTRDGGEQWDRIDVGIEVGIELGIEVGTIDLRAVAVSEAQPEGAELVFAVGDGGAMLHSPDGGTTWTTVTGAEGVDLTGVTVDHEGAVAFASGADGSIWRTQAGHPLQRVFEQPDVSIHAIATSHSGAEIVAVGSEGFVVTSYDGGATWAPVLTGTVRDLFAVRMAGHGREMIAAGQAGVVVRIDGGGVTAQEHLDPALALYGLHVRAGGPGQAVGDAGVVLLTDDLGLSWSPLAIDTDVTLTGVDDFHPGGHL